MDEKAIPLLRASDIECRVQQVISTKNGVGAILLLYKDARVDMRILDEVFGASNWQRGHVEISGNLFCNISVRFVREDGTAEWVTKQDVGVESNMQKEKGQASDSFKRAGTNWGIGRELYTAPFIYVQLHDGEYDDNHGKAKCKVGFRVARIGYNDRREINQLQIVDDKGKQRFAMGNKPVEPAPEPAKVYDAERDGALPVCEACGHKIGIYKGRDGKPISPNRWAKLSYDKYKRTLCQSCMEKYVEELKNADQRREDNA